MRSEELGATASDSPNPLPARPNASPAASALPSSSCEHPMQYCRPADAGHIAHHSSASGLSVTWCMRMARTACAGVETISVGAASGRTPKDRKSPEAA